MVIQNPIPSRVAAPRALSTSARGTPPPELRPCIDALIIGRVMRPPQVGGRETSLVLAVNVASRAQPGTYRRAEHATFLLVRALGAAHQLFQLPGVATLCGRLVRISHCALELTPFTTDYETIDHRLHGCFEQPEHFSVLTSGCQSDHTHPVAPPAAFMAPGR